MWCREKPWPPRSRTSLQVLRKRRCGGRRVSTESLLLSDTCDLAEAGCGLLTVRGGRRLLESCLRVSQGVSRPTEPLRVGGGREGGDSQARLTGSSRWLPGMGAGAGLLAPGRRGRHLPLRSGPQTPGSGRPGLSTEESGCSG